MIRWDVPQANDRAQRMDSLSNSRVSSTSSTTRTATVAETSSLHSAKRRRLYGLNSRFDRMLQEVSWASDATRSFLPRYKRAYSPSSSTMTNHDLPKTPTDVPNEIGCGSRELGKRFAPASLENQLSATMRWRSACLSPSQVVKMGNQVAVKPPSKLPDWLNDTLATLPTDNAVRCLTLPPEPPKRLIRNDHIDWSPDAPDESSVFAFQAPVDGRPSCPVYPAETEGSGIATFQIAHDGYVGFHGGTPVAPLAASVPFSTPGPGWTSPQASASRRPRRPSSARSMYRPTSTSAHKARNSPLPFSTPGPFVPARRTNGYGSDCGLATHSVVKT